MYVLCERNENEQTRRIVPSTEKTRAIFDDRLIFIRPRSRERSRKILTIFYPGIENVEQKYKIFLRDFLKFANEISTFPIAFVSTWTRHVLSERSVYSLLAARVSFDNVFRIQLSALVDLGEDRSFASRGSKLTLVLE